MSKFYHQSLIKSPS